MNAIHLDVKLDLLYVITDTVIPDTRCLLLPNPRGRRRQLLYMKQRAHSMFRRRFPLWLGLTLVAGLAWTWAFGGSQMQDNVMRTAMALLLAAVALIVWLWFFSDCSPRCRILTTTLPIYAGVAAAALFRYDGVDGDLIPILRWRWADRLVAAIPATSSPSLSVNETHSASYPQFRGVARDGFVRGVQLARDWKTHRPELLWKVNCGDGWAGYAVAAGLAVTMEQRDEKEVVICCDLLTGAPIWEHVALARYQNALGGIGPRTTPCIHGERVYAQGATGLLHCLDLKTGKPHWTSNVLSLAKVALPDWGYSASPYVEGDLVYTTPGGLMALHTSTGQLAWFSPSGTPGYSSPRPFELMGQRQFLLFDEKGVSGRLMTDGSLLWNFPWDKSSQRVADPIALGPDRVLAASGYGHGAELLRLALTNGSWTVTPEWKSMKLKAKMSNFLPLASQIYGLNDGRLVCIDALSGQAQWEGERFGHGQLLCVEGPGVSPLLLIMAENGDVALIEARAGSTAPPVLGRFNAIEGKTWNPLALAGRFLLVRNDAQAACYRLPVTGSP